MSAPIPAIPIKSASQRWYTDVPNRWRGADFYRALVGRYRRECGNWTRPSELLSVKVLRRDILHDREHRNAACQIPRRLYAIVGGRRHALALYWVGASYQDTEDDGTWVIDAHLPGHRRSMLEITWGPRSWHAEPTRAMVKTAVLQGLKQLEAKGL